MPIITPLLSESEIHDICREYIYGAKTKEIAARYYVSVHTIWKCVTRKGIYAQYDQAYCLNSEKSDCRLDAERYAARARFIRKEPIVRRLVCPTCYSKSRGPLARRQKRFKTHLRSEGCQYARKKMPAQNILYSENPSCQHCQAALGNRPYQSGKPRLFDDTTAKRIQAIHKAGIAVQIIANRFKCHKRTILHIVNNKGAYKRLAGAGSYD